MRFHLSFLPFARALTVFCLLVSVFFSSTNAQQIPQKPSEKGDAKDSAPAEPQNPAQFELLETKYRFETNGDSRKEVHARVHINSELGVRQFARLNFDYNRSFQSIDIPLVHITHPTGGTADILPSAITDNPNPAVINAPAYQDVRVKSVRILGLAPGDNLEYRVITTTTHHPLAPDFWLDHSFDRTGIVSQELFEIDVPASSKVQLHVTPEFTHEIIESENRTDARVVYRWQHASANDIPAQIESGRNEPDIVLTTLESWRKLSEFFGNSYLNFESPSREIIKKSQELTTGIPSSRRKLEAIYDFVSQKIATIDLPIGSTGFRNLPLDRVLSSAAATTEDKIHLLVALTYAAKFRPAIAFTSHSKNPKDRPASPSSLVRVLAAFGWKDERGKRWGVWVDPGLEVAPFGMIGAEVRGAPALYSLAKPRPPDDCLVAPLWTEVPRELPFAAVQKVEINARLESDGKLTAKVHYALRGDNELLLRVAFHQSPKDKWKELAQLLSLSDGFRGQVTSVDASDPYVTRGPFTVDYEIVQPKFVDWSKKPVRIPALLPQLGLPDPPAKPAPGAATAPIELGTPLEVETKMTLHLPPGTDVAAPTGTSVQRDYATFVSQYSIKGLTVTASRHIDFLLRQVPAERAADYNAFLRAVLSDQAQDFTLDRESATTPATAPPSTPKP